MKRPSSTKKVEAAPSSLEQCLEQGLCSCCKEATTCTYPRVPDHPVLECEEFNGILPPPSKRDSLIKNASAVTPRGVVDEPAPGGFGFLEPRGLCSNCEERETCTFPKPEGGVWHCEEYR